MYTYIYIHTQPLLVFLLLLLTLLLSSLETGDTKFYEP